MDTSDLLKQLRIDKDARAPRARTGRLVLAGVALLTLAGGLLWLTLARSAPPTVRTATARAASQGADGSSVLDASGYVTARRQATVSAKVTGKVTEVLIEEGMRVEEGAVLARLDDTEAKAQLALARAQLAAARSQVAEIRAQLAQAERDQERQRELRRRRPRSGASWSPSRPWTWRGHSAIWCAPGSPPARSRSGSPRKRSPSPR